MMIHPHIRVRVREPGATTAVSKLFQDRMFFEYRNKGIGVYLNTVLNGGKGISTTIVPSAHPMVIESMEHLSAVNDPHLVFDIGIRRTYNVATMQTFFGVVADPAEPFSSVQDLQDMREFSHVFSEKEQLFLRKEWLPARRLTLPVAPTLDLYGFRMDGIAISSDASAIVTSCEELTEQLLVNIATHGHMMHDLVGTGRCVNERSHASWSRFFALKKCPPRIYIGIGKVEFPSVEGKARTALSSSHLAMGKRSIESSFQRPGYRPQSLPSAPINGSHLKIAQQLGVTLLQRYESRYYVVR